MAEIDGTSRTPRGIQILEFDKPTRIFESGEAIRFKAILVAREPTSGIRISGSIIHPEGYAVGTFRSEANADFDKPGIREFFVELGGMHLTTGAYSFRLAICTGEDDSGYRDYDLVEEVLPFEVSAMSGVAGVMVDWHHKWGSIKFPAPTFVPAS